VHLSLKSGPTIKTSFTIWDSLCPTLPMNFESPSRKMHANDIMKIWLDTWAPHCGAPRSVFEGQAKVMVGALFDEIERRSEMEADRNAMDRAVSDMRRELNVPRR